MSDPLPHSLDFAFSQGLDRDHAKAHKRFTHRLAGFEACEKWPECGCDHACDDEPFREPRDWLHWLTIAFMALPVLLAILIIIFGGAS